MASPILIVAEVCTSGIQAHPAHLAAWSHEAEVHLNLTGVGPACSPFVLLADPGLIVPVHARKRRFDACGLTSRKLKIAADLLGSNGYAVSRSTRKVPMPAASFERRSRSSPRAMPLLPAFVP